MGKNIYQKKNPKNYRDKVTKIQLAVKKTHFWYWIGENYRMSSRLHIENTRRSLTANLQSVQIYMDVPVV